MAIRVNCEGCQKSFNVREEYSGRTGKCKHCGASVKIPFVTATTPNSEPVEQSAATRSPKPQVASPVKQDVDREVSAKTTLATASKDPHGLMREILAGFEGDFPRIVPTMGYRVAAVFVAAVMFLLPMVYMAMIALVGYAVYWHAVTNHFVLTEARGARAGKGAALLYAGPLIAGVTMVLFMIKPLFARPAKRPPEVVFSPLDEPILHNFVHRLCDLVHAPHPSLIEVNCEVNAAAFFNNGWWGFLRNDLGLQIGLPLVSALNTRQLAGVLAHEFGHFSQGAGMRLSYVIRSINHWFARVIYERDSWDVWLDSFLEVDNAWIKLVAWVTRFMVSLTRWLLWVLMQIGNAVSCVLLRQMEYDADKYQAGLAGSDACESTTRRLAQLGFADLVMQHTLAAYYESAGLPDDLPLCLSKIARKLPPETASLVEKRLAEEKTGWFDTHPASRDRIAAAYRQNAQGIFRLERPATVLLKEFKSVARQSTIMFYKQLFGGMVFRDRVTTTKEFLAAIEFGGIEPAEQSSEANVDSL